MDRVDVVDEVDGFTGARAVATIAPRGVRSSEMKAVGFVLVALAGVMLGAGCSNDRPQPEAGSHAVPDHSKLSADLEPFLTSYFATWSKGDMEGYRAHFHPDATIYLSEDGRVLMALKRDPFVDSQVAARASSDDPGVEVMTSFTADEDRYAATANVQWELTHDEEVAVGVDRFTLFRDEQWSWKILSLVYYVTGRSRVATPDRARR